MQIKLLFLLGVLIFVATSVFVEGLKHIELPTCTDFKDSRLTPSQIITFPTERMSEGAQTFTISNKIDLKNEVCVNMDENTIFLNQSKETFPEDIIPIQVVHLRTDKSFSRDGHYFDGHFYYEPKPNRFCIKSVSDSSINIRVCKPLCTASDKTSYCAPKCCAPNEIVGYWAGRCRKLRREESSWTPKHSDEGKNTKFPIYQRNDLVCPNGIGRLPFKNVLGPTVNGARLMEKKQNIKLEVINGKLQLMQLSEERQWNTFTEPFCVDGFVVSLNATHTYDDADPENQVAVVCSNAGLNELFMTTNVGDVNHTRVEAWVYAVVSIIASLFLVATIIVYLLLPEKRNFHGMVVLSYILSMLLSYVFYTSAHFVTLFPNEEFTGVGKRGPICMIIAIGSHYFLFASFAWLTMMNIELWRTFRSVQMISKKNTYFKELSFYSAIAWGIPLLLIISFIAVDEVYRDPMTLAIVPDYATTSCSVADWSRGQYVYAPLAIVLFINGILTLITFCLVNRARQHESKVVRKGQERYTAALILKLLCIMGVGWFIQLISWYYNGGNKPWIFLMVDVVMHMQAVALFCLFCCNERTLQALQNEYPPCSKMVNGLKRMKVIMCCGSTSNEKEFQAETEPLNVEQSRNTEYTETSSN